ncbi:MAG: hypothetical protein H6Q65_1934 [Firmicutes bacterium]|nr:hypothetical protein [Bacillota bacterium]
MTIDEILEEMENLLVDATRVPFTNKRVIEEDDLTRLIDELQAALPAEIVEAGRLLNERNRIIEEAKKEAQATIDQAKAYVERLTDENVITQHAQEQAAEIIQQAHNHARDLQCDALRYAEGVFTHLSSNLSGAMEIVQRGHNDVLAALQGAKEDKQK